MDGVLVDFMAGAEKVLGHPFESSILDSVKEQDYDKVLALKEKYWEDLPPMPGMRELWKYINKYEAHILTAKASWERNRGTKEYSRIGKLVWVKRHLQIPLTRVHVVERKDKQKFARSEQGPNVLIDDHPKNIREFNAAGGIGIYHTSNEHTIAALKQLGFS
jgi:hypothetical protein